MRFLVIVWGLLVPLGALGAEPLRGELAVGLTMQQLQNTWLTISPRYSAEVTYERPFGTAFKALRIGGGIRGAAPSTFLPLPFDVFGRVRAVADLGAWQPAAGPEFGVTGWGSAPEQTPHTPGDLDVLQQQRLGPLYFSFTAAPLRFVVGRWNLSALEVQLGSTFPRLGAGIRIGVGLLSVGYAL